MTAVYEIPLVADPQTLFITLNGVTYQLRVTFCDAANITAEGGYGAGGYGDVYSGAGISNGVWILDIYDVNSSPLALGLPLITGANLLEQLGYLNINGQLIVQTDNDPNAEPTFENLGSQGHLYFIPN